MYSHAQRWGVVVVVRSWRCQFPPLPMGVSGRGERTSPLFLAQGRKHLGQHKSHKEQVAELSPAAGGRYPGGI